MKRRWLYTVTDFDDIEVYVNEHGDEVSRDDAVEHIATDATAAVEADRRVVCWERKGSFAARVTYHSQGKVCNGVMFGCTACGSQNVRITQGIKSMNIGERRKGWCPQCFGYMWCAPISQATGDKP